ncbi:hypothetical protein RI367_005476 [Sorochytrium milnesiophthora]
MPTLTVCEPVHTACVHKEGVEGHRREEDDDKDDQDEDNTATVCSKGVAHEDTDVLAKIALNVDAAGGGTDMSDKDATQNDDNNTGGSALAQHETRVGRPLSTPPEHLPIEAEVLAPARV